jgi:transcriptional regulator with XRE-family HTH domain
VPRGRPIHVDDPAGLGKRLRAARLEAGLTQRQLGFAGCSYAYISRIEAGVRVPSLQVIHEFARRLGVSPQYLATGGSDNENAEVRLLQAAVAFGRVQPGPRAARRRDPRF